MAVIDLGDLGSVDVGKRLKTNLNFSSEEFFSKFAPLVGDLSIATRGIIKLAIDSGTEVKTKKSEKEVTRFFEKVKDLSGKFGVGEDEVDEIDEINASKGDQMDEGTVGYDDGTSTYDESSGEKEGSITFGPRGKDGKLVPIKIEEKLKMFVEHDGTPSNKSSESEGEVSLENISSKDRLWDVDLTLAATDKTDVEESKISIRELSPGKSEFIKYNVQGDFESALSVQEYISTINDPEVEFYSLANNNQNDIYLALNLKNTTSTKILNINLKKMIPDLIENYEVISKSVGEVFDDEGDEKSIVWSMDEIEPDAEEKLEIRMSVTINNKDTKLRSGKIYLDYTTPESLSGIEIEKFDAYTNNAFYVISNEREEEPDKYDCQFVFENKSEFMIRLANADVYDRSNSSTKYVDIDPGEIPPIPAGAKWESNVWEYSTENGEYPKFLKKVEFFTIADHQITTKNLLEIDDLELAVAALEGKLAYNVSRLPSYKVTPFSLLASVENTGGADLNEVSLTEKIQTGFQPPNPEDIVINVNGEEVEVKAEYVTIEPEDQDSTIEHTVSVNLDDLKNSDIGALKPGDILEITYPIIADRPDQSSTYVADAHLIANTYPAGKPLEVEVDPIEIEVVHIRKKFVTGKDIAALESENEYEITLYVENKGKFALENYELKDRIPIDATYSDASMEYAIESTDGVDVLTWQIDSIEPDERLEVTYRLSVDGRASDAQDS